MPPTAAIMNLARDPDPGGVLFCAQPNAASNESRDHPPPGGAKGARGLPGFPGFFGTSGVSGFNGVSGFFHASWRDTEGFVQAIG